MFLNLKTVAMIIGVISVSSANACSFVNLPINPISHERVDLFQGKSEMIEVKFHNGKTEGNIEVFPDSPLTVMNTKTKSNCSIDGGVWVRKDIYISENNMVIMAHEFSGSNDYLNFYDTRGCKKIGEIDISNSDWKLEKLNISVSDKEDARNSKKPIKPRIYPLKKYCTDLPKARYFYPVAQTESNAWSYLAPHCNSLMESKYNALKNKKKCQSVRNGVENCNSDESVVLENVDTGKKRTFKLNYMVFNSIAECKRDRDEYLQDDE